jgi:SAM-dependent methyltransferase
MALEHAVIERALDEVEAAVIDTPEFPDFVHHRARYASDAALLSAIREDGPVLEIGSVPGHFTTLLQILGIPGIGVDIAPERLGALAARFGLDVRRCDVEREPLPFGSGSLRQVLCSEVFEHLRIDPLFALAQMNRVLAPGDHLLLSTPNLYAVQQIARFLTGRGFGDPLTEFMKLRVLGHMGHVREYSHREMRRFLAHAGFEVERVWFKHYYFGSGKRGLARRVIFAVAPARFHTFQVILARKVRPVAPLAPLP